MDAVKMLDTMKRICKMSSGCCECILNGMCYGGTLPTREDFDSESLVESIEKWEQEHPLKTRLMDLMEKYPNSHIVNGVHRTTPWWFGYCGSRTGCSGCKYNLETIEFCWNLPIDEKVD